MEVPFEGTVTQCLNRLRTLPTRNIAHLIDFTQANKLTAWGWMMESNSMPTGVYWLRAACFFWLSGWSVTEIASLDPDVRGLAELWAYGTMNLPGSPPPYHD